MGVDADTPRFDYRIYDAGDNGEFLNWCKLDLIENGKVVATHSFSGTTEEPCPSAVEQAHSFGVAWIESCEYTLEERLGPYGIEWEREAEERAKYGLY